jgi:hypothetical protein
MTASTRRWLAVIGTASTVAILSTIVSNQGRAQSSAGAPMARVGAFYFDGWSGPTDNFHFGGLVGTEFRGRRPLSGWRDNRLDALTAQLRWANKAGISFLSFDWYYNPDPGNGPINMAFENYWKLRDHAAVQAALGYINQDAFIIPPDQWATAVDAWVSHYFSQPDYARVDGRPMLFIIDEAGFVRQMGGLQGAKEALEVLRATARRHGLPGVFVVGGRYLDWYSEGCYPRCIDTDYAFESVGWDAIDEYTYPMIVEPRDGPRPYSDAVTGMERFLNATADRSTVRHIPSIMDGFDARPMVVAGQIGEPNHTGWPLLNGHNTWYERTPTQVGAFLRYAVTWVQSHSNMRVEPSPAPPLVMLASWNELQEGAYVVPTDAEGYSYLQAIASAIGVDWTPPTSRRLVVTIRGGGKVTSTPKRLACPRSCHARFDDGWEVTLKAAPRKGFVFRAWTGLCRGQAATCTFNILRNAFTEARFARRGR